MGCFDDVIQSLPIRPMSDILSHYYLHFKSLDRSGVLAKIAGCLGKYNISIQSMIQPECHDTDCVPIVLMTHAAKEADVVKALEEIESFDITRQVPRLIRVEHDLG